MATGQVGFKDNKMVKRVYVEKRVNAIVNRLNKTKVEKQPDLAQEKEDRAKELRKKDRGLLQARVSHGILIEGETVRLLTRYEPYQAKEEARIAKERQQLAYEREHRYEDLHSEEALQASSNQDRDADFLDDFF